MFGRIGIATGGLVLALLLVVTFNTLRLESRQIDVESAKTADIDADAATRRLAESLRIRTVSYGPNAPVEEDALNDLHAFLGRSFPRVHGTLDLEVVSDYSLLFTWRGSDPALKPVLFSAHMDVSPVAPETEADWTHPPFEGAVADGFVWGRGALDMKQSLMGVLEAVEHLLAHGFTPTRTVYLAFGHDEEIGGSLGAAKIAEILEQRKVRLYFTMDEGMPITHGIVPGVEQPAALIGLAEKGYLSLELAVELDPAECGHSSMPPVSTAVGKLARAIHRLETNQMPAALKSPASEMFEYLAPEMSLGSRMVVANRWLFDPLLLSRLEEAPATNATIRTTTAPTIVSGGIKENVLPCGARGIVNFRILPGDSVATVIEHVRTAIDDPDVAIRQTGNESSEPSAVSDSSSASFALLHRTVRQIFPETVVAPGLVIGATDSRHYVKVAENSYRFLPMRLRQEDLKRIHGTDERIAVDNYLEIIRFYIQLLRNVG